MSSRLELHAILENILGCNHVYFQPPSSLRYPCIIYERSNYDIRHADNQKYKKMVHYNVTLISNVADNEAIIDRILELDYCRYERRYVADNMYHDVFDLYF